MNKAVLIFTFSPIQLFISQARRTSDLYAGSKILVRLARAVALSLEESGGELVYPPQLTGDIPNNLVAEVDWPKCMDCAEAARASLLKEWKSITSETNQNFIRDSSSGSDTSFTVVTEHDEIWIRIWERQTAPEYIWEVYWSAAEIGEDGYSKAYQDAIEGLRATKRERRFTQPMDGEPGYKDTLSGQRQALTTSNGVQAYWQAVSRCVGVSRVRPDGKERLDSIGLIKRFGEEARCSVGRYNGFPSTSSVASYDYLLNVLKLVDPQKIKNFADILRTLGVFSVSSEGDFPYDGVFFYLETLTRDRLRRDYRLTDISETTLDKARLALKAIHEVSGTPSPYYGILRLDGDDMGKRVRNCLLQGNPRAAHIMLSTKILEFSEQVSDIVQEFNGFTIYNGGDDVLVLAPLASIFNLAANLANAFRKIVPGGTASVGIAIVHHLYPLNAALQASRSAEHDAKQIYKSIPFNIKGPQKNAVCVHLLKRSGEPLRMRSRWRDCPSDELVPQLVECLKPSIETSIPLLASSLIYDLYAEVYAMPEANDEEIKGALQSRLSYLLDRHHNKSHPKAFDPKEWAERLVDWSLGMPEGISELIRWLRLCHFIAQGGGE